MSGRERTYWFEDDRPIVAWSHEPPESFEDELIAEMDHLLALRRLVALLSPVERQVLKCLVEGYKIPRQHKNALTSLKRKMAGTNWR